ncbi:sugar phosphate isomerase/epimerase [Maribacter sp. PR1]|uniref:Sugar phosphate isomerase/epimerase n=1 Tax=Maribacter cobaltidurans TaxID=1178778 RepID=A0ABU7IPW2_9FLAO|nr:MULTISPECIES: sugar phosphate isomerase/epimerase [Maribacter]MDC6387521.1 sugar phosphate isomerase/epimerase [Maribacter sp. PR1]MEE1974908.1 sugar phosphate isomerase/epimerase [Maribacter cobaltidurans]
MNNKKNTVSRRNFISSSAALAIGTTLVGPNIFGRNRLLNSPVPNSKIKGVQIGVITYSFRSMPDQSAEATLQYVLDSGINAVELMGDPAETFAGKPESPVNWRTFYGLMGKKRNNELNPEEEKSFLEMQNTMDAYNKEVATWRSTVSMDKFKELRKMYNDAGVTIYAFKPNAFGKDNTDEEINYGFKAAKALGASHVTLEHPSDDEHTEKLGEMASKHGIYVAYHGHTQQTPTFWDTALEQSKYNALNLDLGHFVAAGNEAPLEIIKKKHNHIKSMHVKDRQTPEHGQSNVVWGEGDTPLIEALQLMRDKGYSFPATIELEYDIPEGSNAITEVKKCLAFAKNALES